jgi:hypothetical protein
MNMIDVENGKCKSESDRHVSQNLIEDVYLRPDLRFRLDTLFSALRLREWTIKGEIYIYNNIYNPLYKKPDDNPEME